MHSIRRKHYSLNTYLACTRCTVHKPFLVLQALEIMQLVKAQGLTCIKAYKADSALVLKLPQHAHAQASHPLCAEPCGTAGHRGADNLNGMECAVGTDCPSAEPVTLPSTNLQQVAAAAAAAPAHAVNEKIAVRQARKHAAKKARGIQPYEAQKGEASAVTGGKGGGGALINLLACD